MCRRFGVPKHRGDHGCPQRIADLFDVPRHRAPTHRDVVRGHVFLESVQRRPQAKFLGHDFRQDRLVKQALGANPRRLLGADRRGLRGLPRIRIANRVFHEHRARRFVADEFVRRIHTGSFQTFDAGVSSCAISVGIAVLFYGYLIRCKISAIKSIVNERCVSVFVGTCSFRKTTSRIPPRSAADTASTRRLHPRPIDPDVRKRRGPIT